MMTRSAGQATAVPQGGRTAGQTGRGGGQGTEVNDIVDGVPDFSTISTQQLQNLLHTILAQVGDQGSNQRHDRNQNRNAVNDNIQGAIVYTRWIEKMESVQDMSGCRDNQKVDFKTLTKEEFCSSNEMQKLETKLRNHAMVGASHVAYTDGFYELARNGSIKKNLEKSGNRGYPSKDRNGRDDNKRTRTGNAFARTINPNMRENTGHLAKDYRVVPRNVNLINAMNPLAARGACFVCTRERLEEKARHLMSAKAKEQKQEEMVVVRDFTKTQKEHEVHLGLVLELLKEEKLYAKLSKCEFWLREKSKTFDWGKEQEREFQTLKEKLCNAHVLALIGGLKDFVVYCDASSLGLGCVLMQRELFNDYYCEIRYHLGKANVVADALSRKKRIKPKRIRSMNMTLQSSIKSQILAAQKEASNESAKLQSGLDDRTLARLYLNEIVARHSISISIISDHDSLITWFWQTMHEALGTKLDMSTAYHPQTDGQMSPWKGVVHFRKKGKLAPTYVGPFKIIKQIDLVAYRLRLPEELNGVHDTFHVSNIKKCLADVTLQVPLDEIQVNAKLNFTEEPVEILEREIKKLKRSRSVLVKVRWISKHRPEFTWEREDQMTLKHRCIASCNIEFAARHLCLRLYRSKMSFHQALNLIFELDEAAFRCTRDILRKRDCLDRLTKIPWVIPTFVVIAGEGVTAALVACDANRNGDDSHTSGTGRPVQVARKCTYLHFLKCQPLNFKGTEGVVGLSQWFEKMESVFSISNCTVACQVKFAMCTLQENALTRWNSHVKTTTPEAAHAMPWRTLKKMMTDKY
nr:putative reverse transcriptase domain, ribonuclease H-like domain, aspartic peptidase domain protein [Tanacetum cinerariifolium]